MSDGHIRVRTLSGKHSPRRYPPGSRGRQHHRRRHYDAERGRAAGGSQLQHGKIHYDGDFGGMGSYKLNSHSGDIDAAFQQARRSM